MSVLAHAQVKKLVNQIDTTSAEGLRDRALLELLYHSARSPCPVSSSGRCAGGLAIRSAFATRSPMSMTVDQIVEETRSLPHDVMAAVVDRILLAMHSGQELEHAKACWGAVQRRVAEIRSG